MDERMQKMEEDLRSIKERNGRVEAEKAWERSYFRIGLISALTYGVASVVLYSIGNGAPLRNALIPTIGYFLSTQSLPFIKKNWITRRLSDGMTK